MSSGHVGRRRGSRGEERSDVDQGGMFERRGSLFDILERAIANSVPAQQDLEGTAREAVVVEVAILHGCREVQTVTSLCANVKVVPAQGVPHGL